ncbi:CGNR zinc finger domain-containing protein [Nocardia sp. CDC159]|uniref:CGNR zinc finger domain-containing protein n=1 Tax=Nocardia pulmonis TaxID=2951408 RepID=A0A9X2E8G3_9NOCA|nr:MULTISPECIES: CGNR zinc finger domain-containing protein [Nocardia]MCM6775038.1 CGNR zinc finger domain-containing protein [Nocardia pulmonis]MCM6789508.1 CGNR zinc finger domain-containing protein [Nocardia sp. CDC159]
MHFAHDTIAALAAAVELVNSAVEPDTMTEIAHLDAFFDKHGYTGAHTRDAEELAAVRALRTPLRRMLTSDRDTTVHLINQTLATHRALPQLVRHGDVDYHIHAVPPDASLAVRIAVETAMALIDLVRDDELTRLAICADTTCDGIVLDLSRNRSRRYCSTTCGNRNAVAAYRARRKGDD